MTIVQGGDLVKWNSGVGVYGGLAPKTKFSNLWENIFEQNMCETSIDFLSTIFSKNTETIKQTIKYAQKLAAKNKLPCGSWT